MPHTGDALDFFWHITPEVDAQVETPHSVLAIAYEDLKRNTISNKTDPR